MRVRPEGATGGATEVTVNHTVRRRELLSSPPSERWAGARLSRLKLALGMGLAIIGLAFGGLAFGGLAFGAAQAVASPAAPFADDEATTLEAITTLNKKALKEYDNLSFDDARKTLEEALDLCSKNDLDNHPIKARTHVHLGVVLLAMGSTRRNDAIEEFRKAVAIQPDIQPSKRLASPEVQSAFNEAKVASSGGSGRSVATVAPAATAKPANSPLPAPPPAAPAQKISGAPSGATAGLVHDPVRSAARGSVVPITVTTDPSLNAKKVALWFRASGSPKFVSVDLREYTPGNWSGSIPETITAGDEVAYFIAAENGDGEVVGSFGSASAPLVIDLRPPQPMQKRSEPEETAEDNAPTRPREAPTWYLALAAGTGVGYVTGKGDINYEDTVNSGFERSQLGHLLPEVGYFVDSNLILSLQLRMQFVTGATPVPDVTGKMCGSDHVCQPAKGALAALARLTWLLGQGTFVPYLSAAVGAGQVRHLAHFPKTFNCGTDPLKPVTCVDTVTAGPILLGPGAGFIFHVAQGVGLNVGVATLVGFPQFTFHLDLNAGFVVEL